MDFNPNIAHITVNGVHYQVLNADGTDWDEEATKALVNEKNHR
jgi:hypothetical protein